MSYCPRNNRNLDSSCECFGTRKYLCKGQPRSVIRRRGLTSRYHGSKISRSQQWELKLRRQRRQRELEKINRFISAQQQLRTCITLFVRFLAVVARLRRETSKFHAPTLRSRRAQRKNFLFPFLNLDTVLPDLTPKNFAII